MMKKIWMILLLVLTLTGCKTIADIKPDTIVDIPLHPTEVQTEDATEMTAAPTEAPTETVPITQPTEQATQPPRNDGGASDSKPKPTEPFTEAATEPPAQPPTAPLPYDPSGYTPSSLDLAIADAVNTHRQDQGLEPLELDTRLCAIASVRARELSVTWSQYRPDGSAGITVLAEYGYDDTAAGENIYFGPANGAAIVDKWMSSEPRRDNILMEAAAAIGVGSYTAADGLTYVAVFFVE